MTARSDTQIAETFTATTVELAGDLCRRAVPCCRCCREHAAPRRALRHLRPGAQEPAGRDGHGSRARGCRGRASVSLMSRMTSEQAGRLAGVAESLVDVAIDALDTLNTVGDGGEPTVAFAHRLAHATHLASALAGGRSGLARPPAAAILARSGVVAQPGRVAEHAHRDQATLEGRSRVRRLDAPGAGRVRLP